MTYITILFLGGFILVGVWLNVSVCKENKEQHKMFLKEINNRIKLSVNNIKCSGYALSSSHRYFVTKCDMYITDDTLILFTNGTYQIIFTQNVDYRKYNQKIHSRYDVIFYKNYVVIKFGKPYLGSSWGENITLKTLKDTEKKELQNFVMQNNEAGVIFRNQVV